VTDGACENGEEQYVGRVETSLNITVAPGDNWTCTFTNTRDTGTINGSKFNDLNNNGQWDENEPTLSDWTIQLLRCDEQVSLESAFVNVWVEEGGCSNFTTVAQTQTDENGNYSFTLVPTGDYTVCEVAQDGWVQTYPSGNNGCHDVSLDENGQTQSNINFGNFQNGTIQGFKFDDLNGNATFDNGDTKLSNWTINLMQDGKIVTTTKTDANGNYSFTNVAAGDYQVCEVQQVGFTRTFPVNSDCQDVVIDTSGQVATAVFGNKEKGEILGATTLVNTGQPIEYSIILGLGLLSAIGAVSFVARRQNS
jgi:serine-aspartate repeat-containing protein C/D/E